MKIFEVHEVNWNNVKNFFNLDCKAPHLEVGTDYFSINNSYADKLSRFLGEKITLTYFSHDKFYGGPQEERESLAFKAIGGLEGPIFVGGVGLTKQILRDERKACLADKFEQIHCALAYLSPFYSMRLDPILRSKERIMYKAFEEDISWAFLKQIEGSDRITSFRQKLLDEVSPVPDDAKKAMVTAEKVLGTVNPIKEPVKAFKGFHKISGLEEQLKRLDIDVERDYKSFVSVEYPFVRILDNEFEYFQPRFV